jgi:hypothetical protein
LETFKVKRAISLLLVLSLVLFSGPAFAISFKKFAKRLTKVVTAPIVQTTKATADLIGRPGDAIKIAKALVKSTGKNIEESVRLVRDTGKGSVQLLAKTLKAGLKDINGAKSRINVSRTEIHEKKSKIIIVSKEVDELFIELQGLKQREVVFYSTAQTFNKAVMRARQLSKVPQFWVAAYPDHVRALQAILPLYGVQVELNGGAMLTCLQKDTSTSWIEDEDVATERMEECLRSGSTNQSWAVQAVVDYVTGLSQTPYGEKYFSIYDCELRKIIQPHAKAKDLKCSPNEVKDHPFLGNNNITVDSLKEQLLMIRDQLAVANTTLDQALVELDQADQSLEEQETSIQSKIKEYNISETGAI